MSALSPPQLEELTRKLDEASRLLMREVRDELQNVGDLHRADLLNNEPGDSGDESMASSLADLNVARLDRQIEDLRDIEAAFGRINRGEYGTCIDCGEDIGFSRLQAYPTAKRCIQCQETRERQYAQEGHPSL
jgi:RNA polymerase-binding protein DksA